MDMDVLAGTLDAAARLSNASMFVFDFIEHRVVYRTEKLIFMDHLSVKEKLDEGDNPYWALMAEEDLAIVLEAREAYLSLFDGFSVKDKLRHTCIIDYRISLNRATQVVAQKFTPLKLNHEGKLWLGLFCIVPSTKLACQHIELFGDGFRYIYDFGKKRFEFFNGKMELTFVEKEILVRAAMGLTEGQIADELHRSVNTVKTHKKRLFAKLHVASTSEALLLAQNYALF